MNKITHPYFLLSAVIMISAGITLPFARQRARLAEIRHQQEIMLTQLIAANEQASYLSRKRHELLTNPATIAEVAKENYGFVWRGRLTAAAQHQDFLIPQNERRVELVTSGWDNFLGKGEYLWQLPVLIGGLTAAVFALINIAGNLLPKVISEH